MAELTISLSFLAVLIASAFALPLLFVMWIRNTERFGREPWLAILKAFAWGAVFSVIVAIVLSVILLGVFQEIAPVYVFLSQRFEDPEAILAILVVAPIVEEAAKALGVRAGKRHTEVVV